MLWATMNGESNIVLKDEKGGWGQHLDTRRVPANGVIHVINRVVLPS